MLRCAFLIAQLQLKEELVQINDAFEEPNACAHKREQDEEQGDIIRRNRSCSSSHPADGSGYDGADISENTPLYVTVLGLLIGEIASSFFSILFYKLEKKNSYPVKNASSYCIVLEICKYSIPLTTTRIIVGLLQSVENIYIPQNLLLAGYNTADALSLFGVLTGMALPLILFPTAITNSLS